jgi:hypothetical protein
VAQPATVEERVRELHDRAVQQLVQAHEERDDFELILAVQYGLEDPVDVGLFEVLRGFPGDDDDELLVTDFAPSASLVILGKLHLVLGSPAQVRAALGRRDAEVEPVRRGRVVHSDQSSEATELQRALGL